jgi:hypothetical protein
MGHPATDTAARRRFLKGLILEILADEGTVKLSKLTWLVNEVTLPRRYPCKKRGEFRVFPAEVELVLERLVKKFVVEKDTLRRKGDPKTNWPARYRLQNLLTQLAFAAWDPSEDPEPAHLILVG